MKPPYTTRLSSRGQVVIPLEVRRAMRFEDGTHFLVMARGDTIVLHRLKEPPFATFDELLKLVGSHARSHDASVRGFAKVFKKLAEVR